MNMKKKQLTVAIQAALFTVAIGSVSLPTFAQEAQPVEVSTQQTTVNIDITALDVEGVKSLTTETVTSFTETQFVQFTDKFTLLSGELDDDTKTRLFLNLDQKKFQTQFLAKFDGKYGKDYKKFEKELEKELKEYYKAFLPEGIKAKVKVKHGKIDIKFKVDKKAYKHLNSKFVTWIDFEGLKKDEVVSLYAEMPEIVKAEWTETALVTQFETETQVFDVDIATLNVEGIKGLSVDFIDTLNDEQFALFMNKLTLFSGELDDDTKARLFLNLDQYKFQTQFVTLFDGKHGKDHKKFEKELEKELNEFYKAFLPEGIKAKVKVKKDGKIDIKFKVDKKAYKYLTASFVTWIDLEGMKKDEVISLYAEIPETVKVVWTETDFVTQLTEQTNSSVEIDAGIETDSSIVTLDFSGLNALALSELSLEVLTSLNAEKLALIPLTTFGGFLKSQVATLDVTVIESLTLEQVKQFSSYAISGFTAENILGLKPDILSVLGIDLLMSLEVEELEKLVFSTEASVLEWISSDNNMLAWVALNYPTADIDLPTGWTVITLDDGTTQFELTEEVVKTLSVDFISSLTVDHFALLNPTVMEFLTTEQVEAINNKTFALLSETYLEPVVSKAETVVSSEILTKLVVSGVEINGFDTKFVEIVTQQPPPKRVDITLNVIAHGGKAHKIDQILLPGWTFEAQTGKVKLEQTAVEQLTSDILVNIKEEQIVNFEPTVFSHFKLEQIQSLPPQAMRGFTKKQMAQIDVQATAGFTAQQISELSSEAISGLSIDHFSAISVETLSGFTAENIVGLAPDVIFAMGIDILNTIPQTEVEKLSSTEIIKIVSNLDAVTVKPQDIEKFLPSDVTIDINTGKLKLKPGKLKLPKKGKLDILTTVTLPPLPDFNVSFSLGGESTILVELNQTLAHSAVGLSGFSFTQQDSGILDVAGAGTKLSLMPSGDIEQLAEGTPPGLIVNETGNYELITTESKKITFQSAPANLENLLEVIPNSEVEINEYGEIHLDITGEAPSQLVGVFGTFIETAPEGLTPGIHFEGTVGVNEVAKIVLSDGTMQVMSPTVLDRQSVEIATPPLLRQMLTYQYLANGEVLFELEGYRYKAIPELTVAVVETREQPLLTVLEPGKLIEHLMVDGKRQLFHLEILGTITE